jgi:hypothetical protein
VIRGSARGTQSVPHSSQVQSSGGSGGSRAKSRYTRGKPNWQLRRDAQPKPMMDSAPDQRGGYQKDNYQKDGYQRGGQRGNSRGYQRGHGRDAAQGRHHAKPHAYCGFEFCYVKHASEAHTVDGQIVFDVDTPECQADCAIMQQFSDQLELSGIPASEYSKYHFDRYAHCDAPCIVRGCQNPVKHFRYRYNNKMCDTHYCADEQTVAYRPVICDEPSNAPQTNAPQTNAPQSNASSDNLLTSCDSGWEMSAMAVAISLKSSQDSNDLGERTPALENTPAMEVKYFKARDTGISWADDDSEDE